MRHATRRQSRRCPIVTYRRLRPVLEELEGRITPSTGMYLHPEPALSPQITSPNPGQDAATTVTMDAAGHVAVFWQDSLQGASAPVIHGEVNGSPVFTVTTAGTIDAASADTSGDVAIVWHTTTNVSPNTTYYLNLYSPTGTALAGPILLGSGETYALDGFYMTSPPQASVAGDSAGHFMVVWVNQNNNIYDTQLTGQVFDAHGNALSSPFAVGINENPAVAADQNGGFVVVGVTGNVVGQHYDALGNALGAPFTVWAGSGAASPQYGALAVASDGAGNLVAVWSSYAIVGDSHADWAALQGIQGQRFTDTGVLQGGVFNINNTPDPAGSTFEVIPAVAMDAAGDVEVVYGPGAYAERFNAAGHSIGMLVGPFYSFGGTTSPSGLIALPSIAGDPNGDVVLGGLNNGNAAALVATGSNVNRAPTVLTPIAAADQTAFVNTPYQESQSYFTDPDGDPLTYNATLADGSPLLTWLSLDSYGRLWGTPYPSAAGTTYQVKVTATDPYWSSASLVVSLTVPNDSSQPASAAFDPDASDGNDNYPATAVNAAGDSIVVWFAQPGGTMAVMGQVYNAQHQTVGPALAIATGSGVLYPSVTADTSGDFDVSWTDDTSTYLQRVSDQGTLVGNTVTLVAHGGPAWWGPWIAADTTGNLVLVYMSGGPSIELQRFDLNGNPLSAAVAVNAAGTSSDEFTLAVSPTGKIMVVWHGYSLTQTGPRNDQAMMRLFDAQLNPLTDPTPISTGPDGATIEAAPAVAADGLGDFDVLWYTTAAAGDLAVERLSDLGVPLPSATGGTGPTLLHADAPGYHYNIAADGSGNFMVVWELGSLVTAQRYNAGGQPVGAQFTISAANSWSELPAVADNAAGNLLVAWTTSGSSSQATAIAARWYWPTATVQVPAAQTTTAGTALVFSTANGNAITLTGGDPTQVETLTLQANTAGSTVTVTQTAGLASITGNGTASVTLTGTSAVLNAALQRLTVQSTATTPNLTLQVTLAPSSTMSVSGSVPITVHSVPPQVVTPLAAADETAFANVLYYESQNYFTDAGGNALTYKATLANGNPLPAWLNLDSTGRLFGVPSAAVAGATYQVRVTATDPYGGTAGLTLPITVAPDPTEPNGSMFTVVPVAVNGSPAASNTWVNQQSTAVNAAGDAMIVCGMTLLDQSQMIMGQVYNAQHQPVGPVFQVNSSVSGTGDAPTVTADAAGDFDVAWQASTVTYLQRFSPLGVAVGPAVTLAAEQGLQVVADAAGNLILLWTGADGAIYMRRFDTKGDALSPTVQVAASGRDYQAAVSANGNLMVVWETQQAHMQLYGAQLNPLGSAVPIGSPGGAGGTVAVAADGLGNFDVAFQDGNTPPPPGDFGPSPTGGSPAVEFERFSNLGQPLANGQGGTGPTVVATGSSVLPNYLPRVAADRSGNFTIVWSSSFSPNADTFGQRYDPTGRPVGGVFLIPLAGVASIAGDPAGDMLVTDLQAYHVTDVLAGQWYWPTATVQVPAAQSTNLNSTLVFSTANHNAITLAGGDPTKAETLTLTTGSAATLTVTSSAGLASITGNGTRAVKLTGTSAVLNAALQGLTFHPVASALAPTLQVSLAPNAAMSVSGSVPIHVSVPPSNVPPKVTMPSGPLSVAAGSTLVFSTAKGDAITLTDPDAGSTLETLSLYVTSGTLTLGNTSGVKTVAANGTGDVRVTGTLSAVDAALNGLLYKPAAGAKGSVVFNVYLVDSANAMGWASTTLTITP